MNEEIIRRFNERVKPEDVTFVIGDFCFKHPKSLDAEAGGRPLKAVQWEERLNGKIIFIAGNHDNNNSTKTCIQCIHIEYAGQRINLVHKPEHANINFPINLVGHVHDAWKFQKLVAQNPTKGCGEDEIDGGKDKESILLNIGVDQNNFYPITLDEALSQVIKFKKGLLK